MFDNNGIKETMSQNIQSLIGQNVNSVQYTISRDHPSNETQRELKEEIA
jgi:hypothetical protein